MSGLKTIVARAGEWTTYLFVSTATSTGTGTITFRGHADGAVVVDVAALQLVEFLTEEDAYAFADGQMFAAGILDLQGVYALNLAAPGAVPGCVTSAQTLTGATLGDYCQASLSIIVNAAQALSCEVSASDQVTFKVCQFSGAAADPDAGGATYRATARTR